ncbi:right-handed parallel beta-helix repeat-containing protein [Pedobacter montanisoli]|uniref:Right-handed parallel beta-helix repeat-containing protein n=1 Tax=Pedobacter montanisoli TaxID=2923277 RepID=A0ABS9ZWD8_9SPHI|nr:right-handed parallel beta-helix repeat-containing protein [Pedobacter montanisoli]MCJ0742626.1 right-handed parallel beta-helix repeat-containing protein [Pedobacter montanisoli]
MKKLYLKKCCFLLALLLLCSFGIRAQIYVSPSGNDGNDGKTLATAKASLSAAITAIVDPSITLKYIKLSAGTYTTSGVSIPSGVRLVGECASLTTLETSGNIQLQSNSALSGVTVTRPGISNSISVSTYSGSNNISITQCKFIGNRTAIYLQGSNHVISDNEFENNRTGLVIDPSGSPSVTGLKIERNKFFRNRSYGFIFLGSSDNAAITEQVTANIAYNDFIGNLAGGFELNSSNPTTAITLQGNYFDETNNTIRNGRTNGGFTVDDHNINSDYDNDKYHFTDNSSTGYPNAVSGDATAKITTIGVLNAATANISGPALCRAISSSSPSFTGYITIQDAIDNSGAANTINVSAGNYFEDVVVNKQGLKLIGANEQTTKIIGIKGNSSATTLSIAADGAIVEGFTITREGNNITDWNDSYGVLNKQGVSMDANNTTARKLLITGNRNGMYINGRQNVLVEYCDISNNRTGVQVANNISGTIIRNNNITNNWTMGFLFNDPSSPPNPPVTAQATAADIVKNNITDNWYSQVEFRGDNINVLNFGANNLGQTPGVAPSVSTNPSGEPGYAAQIPVAFGGSATAPGSSYMICGAHSDRIDYSADLENYTDTDPVIGYQPNDTKVWVFERGPLATLSPRLSSAAKIVNPGGTILLKDAAINSGGDIPVNATLDADNATIVVNGNLKLNGNNTMLTLAKPATFNGTIEFAGSNIKSTATNTLTASNSIVSGAGYVDGPLKLTGAVAIYDMPLGKGGVQTLISFNNPTAAITAEYFNTDAGNTSTIAAGSSLTAVSNKEYWDVSSTGTVGSVSLTTFDKSGSGISGTLITEVAFYGGTEWVSYGGTSQTASGNKFSVTSDLNPINTISGKFTFGTGTTLPVDLVAFEATRANNGALITWETVAESQNKEFVITKSFDGKKFFELKRLDAKGAGKYSYTDLTFLNSAYYRLTQIDADGKPTTYDKLTRFVKGLNDGVSVTAYPNPTTSKLFVNVTSAEKELVKLQLVDVTGRILKVQQADTSQPIAFDISDAKPGVYTLRILKNTGDLAKKIVKL